MKTIAETLMKAGSRTMGHVRGLGRLGGRCALHGAPACLECDDDSVEDSADDDLDQEVIPEEEADLVNWCNNHDSEIEARGTEDHFQKCKTHLAACHKALTDGEHHSVCKGHLAKAMRAFRSCVEGGVR